MAYTAKDFVRDLIILNTGAALGFKRAAQLQSYAAKKGIAFAGRSTLAAGRFAAGAVARGAAANPVLTGAALGTGYLQTEPGQELLEAARERGRADRIALEQAIDERVFAATRAVESPEFRSGARSTIKRKVSKYQKAVKAGMKAVKASKFNGKKGKITNPKKVFGTVNKVVSAVNKGKKVATKGVRGTIARAARRILK